MIRCSNCGADLPDDARFCGVCGHSLESDPNLYTRLSHNTAGTAAPTSTVSSVEPTVLAGEPVSQGMASRLRGPSSGEHGPTVYTPPPPRRSGPKPVLIVTIIVAVVLIAGVAVGGLWFLTRPQPVIQVSSAYHEGATPAGAAGTSFQVAGQHFASNVAVTFRLDGKALPGAVGQTDSQGNIQVTLAVGPTWPLGVHTLTAVDADNDSTQQGVKVAIVPQGEAHTPGPNGAPPDDASFKLAVTLTGQYSSGQSLVQTLTLIVTGHPDPTGGTVCASYSNGVQDDGQPHTISGSSDGVPYKETIVARCQGTYKNGKLNYTREVLQDQAIFFTTLGTNTCSTPPYQETLQGSFSDATTASGSFHEPEVDVTCTSGAGATLNEANGSWTGHLTS